MKLETSGQLLDFEAPVFMAGEQEDAFLEGLREIFSDVEVVDVHEPMKEYSGSDSENKKWSPDELLPLLSDKSHSELAALLDRTPFSVRHKRGQWLSEFISWTETKGYDLSSDTESIMRMIEEHESNG